MASHTVHAWNIEVRRTCGSFAQGRPRADPLSGSGRRRAKKIAEGRDMCRQAVFDEITVSS